MTIGERIKQLRVSLNLSQDELARKLGYQERSIISLVERGKRGIDTETLIRYADILGVTPTYLLGWEDAIEEDEQKLLEAVCRDTAMKERLMAYAKKLKEILDEENA